MQRPTTETKDEAAPSLTVLCCDVNGAPFNNERDHRSIIGELNFLEKSTRPKIVCAVHQCARFSSKPKQSHASAVKHLCGCLAATKTEGLILWSDPTKSFQVHVDCDFARNWAKEDAMSPPLPSLKLAGHIISCGGCPAPWALKLQTQMALSGAELELVLREIQGFLNQCLGLIWSLIFGCKQS
jgi:hypothetical protein